MWGIHTTYTLQNKDVHTLRSLSILKTCSELFTLEKQITLYGCGDGIMCHIQPTSKMAHTFMAIMTRNTAIRPPLFSEYRVL